MNKAQLLSPYGYAGLNDGEKADYAFIVKYGAIPIFRNEDVEEATQLVKKHYPEGDPFAENRKLVNIAARRALIWILTARLGRTLNSAGKLFGLNHSTIIHHRNSFENGMSWFPADKIIKKLFER